MDVRKLKNKFIKANVVTDDIKVIFRLPDCKSYDDCHCHIANMNGNNVLVIDLIDKIEPKFKVGDVVANISGLYPNVKCTISKVNYNEQYYCYKEVGGVTYFSEQHSLKLVEIEPKFKVGDRVKFVSTMVPEKEYVINNVNKKDQCYTYFNGGHITPFKDQDKLILVKDDKVRPPVESEDKLDILAKAHAGNVKYNTLKYNTEHYPAIVNMMNTIIKASNEGKIICSFIFPDKMVADDSGVYYEEDEICGIVRWHFDKLGFDVKENVNDKNNYVEFIISW